MHVLEDRVYFDGAGVVGAPAEGDTQDSGAPAEDDTQDSGGSEEGMNGLTFIDASILNKDAIIASAGADQVIELSLTDEASALQQMTNQINNHNNLSSIKIFSHGDVGYFTLNEDTFTRAAINADAALFNEWADNMTETCDILIYGSRAGSGVVGTEFMQALAEATTADIAAADTSIGGTNWDLTCSVGDIETFMNPVAGYSYYLDNQLVTTNNSSGVGSLRYAVDNTVAGGGVTFDSDYTINAQADGMLYNVDIDMSIIGTGQSNTILSAKPAGGNAIYPVMFVPSNITLQLSNVTIQDGVGLPQEGGYTVGGGLVATTNSVVELTNIKVTNNSATYCGGIYTQGNIAFNNVEISNNTIAGGFASAFYIGGSGIATIEDSHFIDNSAVSESIDGAIFAAEGTTLDFHGTNSIEGNTVEVDGVTYSSTLTAYDVNFNNSTLQLDYTMDTLTSYDIGGSTIIYTGSSDYDITPIDYYNLNIYGSGVKSTDADTECNVDGALIVGDGVNEVSFLIEYAEDLSSKKLYVERSLTINTNSDMNFGDNTELVMTGSRWDGFIKDNNNTEDSSDGATTFKGITFGTTPSDNTYQLNSNLNMTGLMHVTNSNFDANGKTVLMASTEGFSPYCSQFIDATKTIWNTASTLSIYGTSMALLDLPASETYGNLILNTIGAGSAAYNLLQTDSTVTSQLTLEGSTKLYAMSIVSYDSKQYDGTTEASYFESSVQTSPYYSSLAISVDGYGSFADAAVGEDKRITSECSYSGSDVDRYLTETNVYSYANIDPATLTIKASDFNKDYGLQLANNYYSSSSFTVTGLVGGDLISNAFVDFGNGGDSGAEVNMYSVTTSNINGAGVTPGKTFNADNYSIEYLTSDLYVDPADLSIIYPGDAKVYGDVLYNGYKDSVDFSIDGLKNDETIAAIYVDYGDGKETTADIGNYNISLTDADGPGFNDNNYNINYNGGILEITPALLEVSIDNQSKVYGQTLINGLISADALSVTGLVNNEQVSSADINYNNGGVATANVADYNITLSNLQGDESGAFEATNYSIAYDTGILNVLPVNLTIDYDESMTKTYGDIVVSVQILGENLHIEGLQNSDIISSATVYYDEGGLAMTNVGAYSTTMDNVNGPDFNDNNYVIEYNVGDVSVTPRTMYLYPDNQSKTYGQTFVFDTSDCTVGDELRSWDEVTSITLESAGTSGTANVGNYDITAPYYEVVNKNTGISAATNYTTYYNTGTMTVTPAPLEISTDNQSKVYGQTLINGLISADALAVTGLVNNEQVSSADINYNNGGVATANVGDYDITLSNIQGDGSDIFATSNYAIEYIVSDLNVTPANLEISNDVLLSKTYGDTLSSGQLSAEDLTIVGLQNNDNVSSVTIYYGEGGLAVSNVGVYDTTISDANGANFNASNYEIIYGSNPLTIDPRALQLYPKDQEKPYADTFVFETSDCTVGDELRSWDEVTSITLESGGVPANTPAGEYDITILQYVAINSDTGLSANNNYTMNYNPGTLEILYNPPPPPIPINDGTDTNTHTSWKTSIDSASEDNLFGDVIGGEDGMMTTPFRASSSDSMSADSEDINDSKFEIKAVEEMAPANNSMFSMFNFSSFKSILESLRLTDINEVLEKPDMFKSEFDYALESFMAS